MKKLINELGNNYYALIALTEANLKTMIASTRLGWLWWIISPLLMMMVYYVFVNIILQRGGDNFHLFILTGLIPWNYFSSSFTGAAGVIQQNEQLVKQVALPIPMLILVPVLVQMVLAGFGVLVIMIWNFQALGFHTFLIIPLILLIGMTSYAFGLFISVFTVYISDITQLLQYVLRMAFFLSPVLFSADRVLGNENVPEFVRFIYYLNPMVTLINGFRAVLLDGRIFDFSSVLVLLVSIVLLIQIGLVWVRLNSTRIVKML